MQNEWAPAARVMNERRALRGGRLSIETRVSAVRVLLIGDAEVLPTGKGCHSGERERFEITRKARLTEGLDAIRETTFELILSTIVTVEIMRSEHSGKGEMWEFTRRRGREIVGALHAA
jgi:hypothetical protein